MTPPEARGFIEALGLARHPEGGWYRETWRAAARAPVAALDGAERSLGTAIVYLLEGGDFSAFHRVRSDELWCFHAGDPLELFVLDEGGGLVRVVLGAGAARGESFQHLVPAGCWQAARVAAGGAFAVLGCVVVPGFEFDDFELADRRDLAARFPEHAALIGELTR
ncbi:MAG: cupin domain-containing protein [Acidobacteria bacterium]|nr:MAG: cupin domain-containing protein [Acidobacteriota bacterium]